MKKRLILASLGVMAILVGLAAFAANTAQWVNVTAHVEKEIEVACVKNIATPPAPPVWRIDPAGCNYGTVFPQEVLEKLVEVTMSKSFVDQPRASDILFHVLWECKLVKEGELATGPTGTNPCREDLGAANPLKLTGPIRDYVNVYSNAPSQCESKYTGLSDGLAKLGGIFDGKVDKDASTKCIYHLALDVPVCKGHFNPNTEPGTPPLAVDCIENVKSDDPQQWERYADLGDTFKIQVDEISYD